MDYLMVESRRRAAVLVFDLTLQTIFMRAGALVLIVAVQGMAIAAAAAVLGDPGPRQDGRLGPSPERHLDALGAAGLILFGLGWGRHVDVDARRLRGGPLTVVLVVLTGAAALVAAAVLLRYLVAPALTTMSGSGALVVAAFLRMAAALCLANSVFPLLPVPPLPGGHLLASSGSRCRALARRAWPRASGPGGERRGKRLHRHRRRAARTPVQDVSPR